MRIGNKTEIIKFRVTPDQYASLYRIYKNYQASCPNLTISDFFRNLLLSIVIQYEKQTNDVEHQLSHERVSESET